MCAVPMFYMAKFVVVERISKTKTGLVSRMHIHNNVEVIKVTEGEIRLDFEDNSVMISAGDVICINSRIQHSVFITTENTEYYYIQFKKTKILEKFWMECNITEGLSYKLPEEFIMFSENLNMIYFKRDMKLKTNLVLHDCGLDNYRKYYDYAVELYHKGIHQPDCKIIVDAHDCGLTNNNLIFVSNDRKMVENISKIDASYLHIVEFRTCN